MIEWVWKMKQLHIGQLVVGVGGWGHKDLPLSVRPYGMKSLCRAYLWNHCHYRLQTSEIHCSGCEFAHLGIFTHSVLSFTQLWPLILWKYYRKVCVARIFDTFATTYFKLKGYIALGVNFRTLVFSSICFYHLQSFGLWICENMDFSVFVGCNSETIGTTDLKLQRYMYIVQGGVMVERSLGVRKVAGSIPNRDIPKVVKRWYK